MPSRLDYVIQKLDDLEHEIRREKREYDDARERYDKMRSSEILRDLKKQLSGYQTERDQIQRARSAREKAHPAEPQQRQHHHHHQPRGRPRHPSNAQQRPPHMPPPPQQRTNYPHRPAPQHNGACPPRNNYGPGSNRHPRPAPPRPHQKTQTVDYEVEEPDGKTYVVRGGAVFRDFDPARDSVRKTE